MKATGIVRRVDDLGRVVIPKEIRRSMGIKENSPLEIYVSADSEQIILQRYEPLISNRVKALQEDVSYWCYDYSAEQQNQIREVNQAFKTILNFLSDVEEFEG